MPEIKRKHGRPPNNGHIHGTDKNMLKKAKVKKEFDKNNTTLSHLSGLSLDSRIPQNAVLEVHNLLGDGHCGFQSLAVAIFQEEGKWQDVKIAMKSQLTKQQYIYGCSREYWFYVPECAQLASDTFNIPIAAFSEDSTSSLFFLPFDKKPGSRKKPIILHWHGKDHVVLVKFKQHRDIQVPHLNPQYIPIC
ncbi:2699_t:CDS:2 [Dentiscutata erythropus]|uniref:2699_t:CDS:1 n=1 Tax=Dentiscutata erythropus TaxID=1348616 RepID=A0A9N9HRY9_9GLOM|nr:2699_t:CDS:2 [Dentiscutata erythropus]